MHSTRFIINLQEGRPASQPAATMQNVEFHPVAYALRGDVRLLMKRVNRSCRRCAPGSGGHGTDQQPDVCPGGLPLQTRRSQQHAQSPAGLGRQLQPAEDAILRGSIEEFAPGDGDRHAGTAERLLGGPDGIFGAAGRTSRVRCRSMFMAAA